MQKSGLMVTEKNNKKLREWFTLFLNIYIKYILKKKDLAYIFCSQPVCAAPIIGWLFQSQYMIGL